MPDVKSEDVDARDKRGHDEWLHIPRTFSPIQPMIRSAIARLFLSSISMWLLPFWRVHQHHRGSDLVEQRGKRPHRVGAGAARSAPKKQLTGL
jgi:hypothetical protein